MMLWLNLTLCPLPVTAQSAGVEVGAHLGILRLSELDTTDVGVGTHVVVPLASVVAVDATLTWFPGVDDLEANVANSQDRVLGMAGLRATVPSGNVEVFARGSAGFLRLMPQRSVVCIAVFPPPLGCRLATGYTAFTSRFGGGASVGLRSNGQLRVHIEAGDLLVRYGLEAVRPNGEITDGFVDHNLLVSIGLGWRF